MWYIYVELKLWSILEYPSSKVVKVIKMCEFLSSPSESGRSAVPSVRPAAVIFINFQIRIRFGERERVPLLSVWFPLINSYNTTLFFFFNDKRFFLFFSILDILDQTLWLPHLNKRTHHIHGGRQVMLGQNSVKRVWREIFTILILIIQTAGGQFSKKFPLVACFHQKFFSLFIDDKSLLTMQWMQ